MTAKPGQGAPAPILATADPALEKVVREQIATLGLPSPHVARTCEQAIERLMRDARAVLVLDWAMGAAEATQVLAAIKGHFLVEVRPILLVCAQMDPKALATGAEFGVSQVHEGVPQPATLRSSLAALLAEDADTRDVQASLVEIATVRSKGEWELATGLLRELAERQPTHERVQLELAENLIVEGHLQEARALLEPLAGGDPPHVRALHLLGRALMREGRYDDAIEHLSRAKLLSPHNVDRLVELGQVLLTVDRVDEARESFEAASELAPERADARSGQGTCMLLAGEVSEALSLMKAMSGPREIAAMFNTAAIVSMRHGRHAQGINLYRAALKAIGGDKGVAARVHFNLGLGYRRWGKLPAARAAFDECLALDPTFAKAQRHRAAVEAAIAGGGAPAPAAKGDGRVDRAAFEEETFAPRRKADDVPSLADLDDELLGEGGLSSFDDEGGEGGEGGAAA
jgi:Flp pilus assembly protein TadD